MDSHRGRTSASDSGRLPRSAVMNQRKRKRMDSNRESARRSRLRKQKYLEDLTAQASLMKKDSGLILVVLDLAAAQCLGLEYENSILRAQVMELSSRLHSLHKILQWMSLNGVGGDENEYFVKP